MLRQVTASLRNGPMRSAYNSWRELSDLRHRQAYLVTNAVRVFTNVAVRRCLNSWIQMSSSIGPQLVRLRQAAAHFRPQTRKMACALGSLIEAARRGRSRRKGLAAFRDAGSRKALRQWSQVVADGKVALQALRRGGAALFMRKARSAFNSWLERWSEIARLRAAVARFSPEGKAMAGALEVRPTRS